MESGHKRNITPPRNERTKLTRHFPSAFPFAKIVQLGVTGARQVSTTQVRQDSAKQIANYQKLKAKQKLFQEENGLLVHEKGGIFDKILYQTTVALCGVGLGMAGKLMYDMACPQR